jgi:subtilase family protein
MTDNGTEEKDFSDHGDEELVVDLPYVGFVADRIGSLGGTAQVSARSDSALGLGLVTVKDIEVLSAAIRSRPKDPNEKYPPREAPRTNVGVVLDALRRLIRHSHGGWVPALGRNRTVSGVHGSPHIGGSAYPEVVLDAYTEDPPFRPAPYSAARIGLIDTKLYPAERFNGRVVAVGDSLLQVGARYTQLSGHGTFSAGLILDEAPGATIVAHAVLSDLEATSTVWEVATAIARFADRDVSVLALPLVCFTKDGEPPLALQRAVDLLRNKVLVLAAAGNHGDAKPNPTLGLTNISPAFPAACDGVVAVGAVGSSTENGVKLAEFTPQQQPWIDLVGPGEEVKSTFVHGIVEYKRVSPDVPPPTISAEEYHGRARWSGTSFATATLGGLMASRAKDGKTVFEVLDELREQNPRSHHGIGGYQFL